MLGRFSHELARRLGIVGEGGPSCTTTTSSLPRRPSAAARAFTGRSRDVEVPVQDIGAQGMHGALREMLRYLRTGEMPQTECHDNIRSLAMVFAAMESSRGRERVLVKF